MINPTIRTIDNTVDTVPQGTSKAGTFTALSTHKLQYSGTAAALQTILGQGQYNSTQEKINQYIWLDGFSYALKVLSWGGKVVTVDGDTNSASALSWELIESTIFGWSVSNTGDTDGSVNGTTVSAGATLSFNDGARDYNTYPLVVDATGTTFLVEEFN